MGDKIFTTSNLFVSRWTIKPERREEFFAIFNPLWQGAVELMNENSNFVYYGVGRNPNVMVAIESYHNEEAVAALRQTPGFKETVSRLLECCSEPMTMELFTGINGTREFFETYPAGKSKVHPSDGLGTIFL